ncbi:MAG: ABC transporter substrate-binding protein [Candidatus Aenigmatarchaeota archaeon]
MSMNRKWIIVLFFISILIIFGAMSLNSNEGKTLKVGILPIADFLPIYVAQENGYFNDMDLKIETVAMSGGNVVASAVNSGDIKIGGSNVVSLIRAHDEGFNYKIIGPLGFRDSKDNKIIHQLLVKNNSSLEKPADLTGKTIAVNTLGNINELVLKEWLNTYNMSVSEVSLVEVPFPQMENALKNNKIDAAMMVEPFVTIGKKHGSVEVLDKSPMDVISPNFLIAGWFAEESWITDNEVKIKKFRKAIDMAIDYINENPRKSRAMLPKYTKLGEELAYEINLAKYQKEIANSDIQVLIDSCYDNDLINNKSNASQLTY